MEEVDLEVIGRLARALTGAGEVTSVQVSGEDVRVCFATSASRAQSALIRAYGTSSSPRIARVPIAWARRKLDRIRAMSKALDAGAGELPA